MQLVCASCNGRQPIGITTRCYYCAGRRLIQALPVGNAQECSQIAVDVGRLHNSLAYDTLLSALRLQQSPSARDDAGDCLYCGAKGWYRDHANGCDYVKAVHAYMKETDLDKR
jgi:hypothetical protein